MQSFDVSNASLIVIGVIVLWDIFWKGLALWRAGRHNQAGWFVLILILNTAGILPIIYLVFFQKDKHSSE